MKKIIKITSILGVATVVRMLSGLARAKFLAWRLGPIGVGIGGQAMMYFTYAIQFCSLNLGMGITKSISKSLAQKNNERPRLIINIAGTFQIIASILFIFVTLSFSWPLTKFIFSDHKYILYFIGITIAIPFGLYLNGMANPIFYGFRKVVEYTKLVIFTTLIGLLLLFIFVYFYNLEGLLMQIVVISVISFAVSYWYVRVKASIDQKLCHGLLKDKKSRALSSHLFRYGLISFIPGNTTLFTMFFLRGFFMKQYGVEANGYYQVAYAMSAYYLPFVTNALWGHFYPEMCALKSKDDINRELNQFVRFALFASTMIAAFCVIFRKYIILTLFSGEFMKAYDLIAIQAIGDIFFVLFCMFSTSLMARAKFKDVILFPTIIYNLSFIVVYFLLSNIFKIDFKSLNIALGLTNFILVAAYILHARFDTGFILTRPNVFLFIKSGIFISIILFLPDMGIMSMLIKAAISAAWLSLSVTKREIDSFVEFAFSSLKRNNLKA